jgi:hypothetical protein
MWYKIQSRLIWTQQVRPSWWQPWVNTIAYYPLETDILDHSGNSNILNGVLSQDTIWYRTSSNVYFTNGGVNFLCWWFKMNTVWTSWQTSIMEWQKNAISYYWFHDDSSFNKRISLFYTLYPTYYSATSSWDISTWWWHYLAYSYKNWKMYICKDWVTELLYNWSWAYNWDNVYLLILNNWGSGNITFSNIIAESVWWSEDLMTSYYNNTKSKYWL